MTYSINCVNLVKTSEGRRLKVYTDLTGNPTIGFGHKLTSEERGLLLEVDEQKATTLLEKDLTTTCNSVNSLVRVAITQGQLDALVSFTFNLGAGRLKESTLLKYLNNKEYDNAGKQILVWNRANGIVVKGLDTRRKAEFELWNKK
jgi:lysozyme